MRPTSAFQAHSAVARRYFDNAATSFPKPPGVAAAMMRCMTELGAPGRGLYAEAQEVASLIRICRERVCQVLHAPRSNWANVVFGYNTTDALNLAIRGTLTGARRRSSGPAHVVTTAAEHNSVLRPLNRLSADGVCEWDKVPIDPRTGLVDPEDLVNAIRPGRTALVAVNHASNVSGAVQDIGAIGRAVRARGDAELLFLVDAAQSLGHIEVNVDEACADLVAFPGHKGLLGPQGTGGLWIRKGVETRLDTVREGGTGNVSELETHPTIMPEKFEPGSHNAVGIAGLSEGIAWLLDRTIDSVRSHEAALSQSILDCFDPNTGDGESGGLPGLRLIGLAPSRQRVGVFSLVHENLEPTELATVLETEFGVLSRPGLHCAPLVHRAMGTLGEGARGAAGSGACRISLGPFLTDSDVQHVLGALRQLCGAYRDLLVQPRR